MRLSRSALSNLDASMQTNLQTMHSRSLGLSIRSATRPQARGRPSLLPVRAASSDEGGPSEKQAGRVTGGDSTKGFKRPDDAPLRLEKVERLGEEAWAGVASIDRSRNVAEQFRKRKTLLWAGDAAVIMLFAAIGRGSHAELDGLYGVISTSWPFLGAWYVMAPIANCYGSEAVGTDPKAAATAATRGWVLATPVALILRGVAKGAVPPLPFVVVASVATGVLLIGWRTAFAALTKDEAQSGGNKQGGPFEFMRLLGSLTKRW
jgi:hypothetical protein